MVFDRNLRTNWEEKSSAWGGVADRQADFAEWFSRLTMVAI